jgi:hypothetical protein
MGGIWKPARKLPEEDIYTLSRKNVERINSIE